MDTYHIVKGKVGVKHMKNAKENKVETVMTYDEWVKERKRRMKRKFAKKWNRCIESVRETLHSFSIREKVMSALAITSVALMVTVMFPYAANADTDAECVRVAKGRYYDYMCVVTKDGNEWLLDDSNPTENRYMECRGFQDGNGIYMPIFHNEERVRVTFDTKGTEDVTDDEITNVESMSIFRWFRNCNCCNCR